MSDAESLRWDAEQEQRDERDDCPDCEGTGWDRRCPFCGSDQISYDYHCGEWVGDGYPCETCSPTTDRDHPSLTVGERNPGLATR